MKLFFFIQNRFVPTKLFVLILVLFYCGRANTYVHDGLRLEEEGRKMEALYKYTLAVSIQNDHPLANKRLGMLLAESDQSASVAVYHLEKARLGFPEDLELFFQLADLYIRIHETKKIKELLPAYLEKLDAGETEFMKLAVQCLENPSGIKKAIATKVFPENTTMQIYKNSIWKACRILVGLKNEK